MLLPQKIHEVVVLFTGARGDGGGAWASQGVILVTDWKAGNLPGRTQLQMTGIKKKCVQGKGKPFTQVIDKEDTQGVQNVKHDNCKSKEGFKNLQVSKQSFENPVDSKNQIRCSFAEIWPPESSVSVSKLLCHSADTQKDKITKTHA